MTTTMIPTATNAVVSAAARDLRSWISNCVVMLIKRVGGAIGCNKQAPNLGCFCGSAVGQRNLNRFWDYIPSLSVPPKWLISSVSSHAMTQPTYLQSLKTKAFTALHRS